MSFVRAMYVHMNTLTLFYSESYIFMYVCIYVQRICCSIQSHDEFYAYLTSREYSDNYVNYQNRYERGLEIYT